MKRTAKKEKECITVDSIYEFLNEQTKQDLENHSEKEYLKYLLDDYCEMKNALATATMCYNNSYEFVSTSAYTDVFIDEIAFWIALEQRKYKTAWSFTSGHNATGRKEYYAGPIGYAIINEYERVFLK